MAEPASGPSTSPVSSDEGLARGLAFLARHQSPSGAISVGSEPGQPAETFLAPPLMTTGLAVLAFTATGNPQDVGRYGGAVRAAVDYLVEKIPADGYAGSDQVDGGKLFGQGIVTVALAEVYGLETDRDRRQLIRGALDKLLHVILTSQAVEKSSIHAGGWGVQPDAKDSDFLMTIWNVLALRACRDAGLAVPDESLARAVAYVLRCRNATDKGFAYQPGSSGEFGATAVGLLAMQALRNRPNGEWADAIRFFEQAGAPPTRRPQVSSFFVVEAAMMGSDREWTTIAQPAWDETLKAQSPDGGWPAGPAADEPGRVYATAVAVLKLSAAHRLLPCMKTEFTRRPVG